jgi:hypothetical protein
VTGGGGAGRINGVSERGVDNDDCGAWADTCDGLRYSEIFGDDFKNPVYVYAESASHKA